VKSRSLRRVHFWKRIIFRSLLDQRSKSQAKNYDNLTAWVTILCVALALLPYDLAQSPSGPSLIGAINVLALVVFAADLGLRGFTASVAPAFKARNSPWLSYLASGSGWIDLLAIVAMALVASGLAGMLEALLRCTLVLKLLRFILPAWEEFRRLNASRSIRQKVYAILEPTPHSGILHHYADNFFIFWVLLSVVSVIAGTVDAPSIAQLAETFTRVEYASLAVFCFEYLLRLYSAPENPRWRARSLPRLRQATTFSMVVDLLAIVPTLLELVGGHGLDLRFLRVFRLLRLLKLTRYTSAVEVLYQVVRREWQVMFAAVFVMMLLVVFTASVGYLFEHDAQADKFENIPQAIYWAVITLASVGYGDISPITPMGRVMTVILALLGIGIFAIPAGLLASAFTDQLRLDREAFRSDLVAAIEQGVFDPLRNPRLAERAARLHLSSADVKRIADQASREVADRQTALERSGAPLLLDPFRQPDLAGFASRASSAPG